MHVTRLASPALILAIVVGFLWPADAEALPRGGGAVRGGGGGGAIRVSGGSGAVRFSGGAVRTTGSSIRTMPMGGIAGNHPYFYRGTTGQNWVSKFPVGYRPSVSNINPYLRDVLRNHHHHNHNHLNFWRNPWWYNGYGYGNYYNYPGYDTYYEPRQQTYTQPEPQTRIVYVVQKPAPRDAWSLMSTGEYEAARGKFAIDATQGSAKANLGYALASALAGKHGDAAWAMRKALEQDTFVMQNATITDVRGKLDALAADYTSGAAKLTFADDRWFMAAATHYLRGDTAAAKTAIANVKDAEKSTANLRALLAK